MINTLIAPKMFEVLCLLFDIITIVQHIVDKSTNCPSLMAVVTCLQLICGHNTVTHFILRV